MGKNVSGSKLSRAFAVELIRGTFQFVQFINLGGFV